jgi:uncharacterized protein
LTARFAFGGHDFLIVDKTALFWAARRALIVADLHLEKASWFAERGQMLPPYDSQATFERIAALVSGLGAEEVWCLGDNFHDDEGPARLPLKAAELLAALTSAARWHWITGNHDEHLPEGIGGDIQDEANIDGLTLRHQADPLDTQPELSGHFHPKVRVKARGRSVTRPCFIQGNSKLILPSFGSLTGGMDAGEAAKLAGAGKGAKAILTAAERLVTLPLAVGA